MCFLQQILEACLKDLECEGCEIQEFCIILSTVSPFYQQISKFKVPLPSIEEQNRIVGILDTFEASIANLEEQLKAREKQFEYYRNKLLTFE